MSPSEEKCRRCAPTDRELPPHRPGDPAFRTAANHNGVVSYHPILSTERKRGNMIDMNALGYWTMAIATIAFAPGGASASANRPTAAEIREIAASAYTSAYPLVLLALTRRTDSERRAQAGLPGANQSAHAKEFPADRTQIVIR